MIATREMQQSQPLEMFRSIKTFSRLSFFTFAVSCPWFSGIAGFTEELAAAKEKGPAAVEALQRKNVKAEAENPDFYIALANYWFTRSRDVTISTKPAEKTDFVVSDQKNGNAIGSISRAGIADSALSDKAPALLADAWERFPQRIDIALGLAFILMKEDRPSDCQAVLEGLLKRLRSEPGSFTNKVGKQLSNEEAASLLANACYDRAANFYQAGDKSSAKSGEEIASMMFEAFPKDPRGLNLLAAFSDRAGDSKAALIWLEKAHAIDPKDPIVTLNLAEQYLAAGKKEKAREFAQSVVDSGEKSYQADAHAILKKIK